MYRLVQLSGAEAGKSIPIEGTKSIGRSTHNHIVINDPQVSRDQATLQVHGQQVALILRDAAVPIQINGQRMGSCSLRTGDVITFGSTQFQLQFGPEQVPHTPNPLQQPPADLRQMGQNATIASPGQAWVQPQPVMPQMATNVQHGGQQIPGSMNVNVVQQNNSTGIWVLLAFLFAGPLLCVSLLAVVMLPFTMCIVGAIMLAFGLAERARWTRFGYVPPAATTVKIYGGGISLGLGLVWIVAAYATPQPPPKLPAPGGYSSER